MWISSSGAVGLARSKLLAGWDSARGVLVVLVESAAGLQTVVVKDGAASAIADVPGARRFAMEHFRWLLHFAQEPNTGRALLFRLPPDTSYSHTQPARRRDVKYAEAVRPRAKAKVVGPATPHMSGTIKVTAQARSVALGEERCIRRHRWCPAKHGISAESSGRQSCARALAG
jgi:hypothetical protein